jgi:hypothetical protein
MVEFLRWVNGFTTHKHDLLIGLVWVTTFLCALPIAVLIVIVNKGWVLLAFPLIPAGIWWYLWAEYKRRPQ